MKKNILLLVLIFSFPAFSQDLNEAVLTRVSADHAAEVKSGDFSSHKNSMTNNNNTKTVSSAKNAMVKSAEQMHAPTKSVIATKARSAALMKRNYDRRNTTAPPAATDPYHPH